MKDKLSKQIDWPTTLIPCAIAVTICVLMVAFPEGSLGFIGMLRNVLVNKLGSLYLVFGLVVLGIGLYVAFSRFGRIKLGNLEKPRYSNFSWFSMIFTSTMAADLLYWSLLEWSYYYQDKPFGLEMDTLAAQDWASTYPLFHWGPIAWIFYILPAAAYGYMMFVKGRHRQKLSEACRPILGKRADGAIGKSINILAIVCLIMATASTFTFVAPVLSATVSRITGLADSVSLAIALLVITAVLYSSAVITGIKGIKHLANICVGFFFVLLAIFLVGGDPIYMLETGIAGIGKMLQNFIGMSTWTDPLRLSGDGVAGFPQNWTVFYWAFWIAWFVATPFFIGKISEGRTIRQTILGGLGCGLAGTYTAMTIIGNYGLHQQVTGAIDVVSATQAGASAADIIISIFETLPVPTIAMAILTIAMMLFSASTFDALTLVVSEYSLKDMKEGDEPHRLVKAFWCVVFVLVPIALLIVGSQIDVLQMFCIVAALPLAIIMALVIASFIKQLREDMPPQPAIELELAKSQTQEPTPYEYKPIPTIGTEPTE